MHRILFAVTALAVAIPAFDSAHATQSAKGVQHLDRPAPDLLITAAGPGQLGEGAMSHGPMTGEGTFQVGDLTVEIPWARATAGRAGGAFMMIHNSGSQGDRLVGARSEIAGRLELHTTVLQDGVMKMREVEGGVEVPAGGMAELKPGGFHVMMMGLKAPLEEGGSFPLTLTFEQAGSVTVDVVVRPAGAMDAGIQHGN